MVGVFLTSAACCVEVDTTMPETKAQSGQRDALTRFFNMALLIQIPSIRDRHRNFSGELQRGRIARDLSIKFPS